MTILCHRELEELAIEQGRVPLEGGGWEACSTADRVLLLRAPTDDAIALGPGLHRWAPVCECTELSHN